MKKETFRQKKGNRTQTFFTKNLEKPEKLCQTTPSIKNAFFYANSKQNSKSRN